MYSVQVSLRDFRLSKGFKSQSSFARKLKLSQTTISYAESGNPSSIALVQDKIREVYNTEVYPLLDEDLEPVLVASPDLPEYKKSDIDIKNIFQLYLQAVQENSDLKDRLIKLTEENAALKIDKMKLIQQLSKSPDNEQK